MKRGRGRPKGTPQSPETRAKISAAVRARWASPEGKAMKERALAALAKARKDGTCWPPVLRPLPGTPERRLFDKIANELGAAAAHAELRRGA